MAVYRWVVLLHSAILLHESMVHLSSMLRAQCIIPVANIGTFVNGGVKTSLLLSISVLDIFAVCEGSRLSPLLDSHTMWRKGLIDEASVVSIAHD